MNPSINVLERLALTARTAYRQADTAVQRAEHAHGYQDDRAGAARLVRDRASARLLAASEELCAARNGEIRP